MNKLVLAFLLPASLAFPAGPFSIGVKGGVPATDAFKTVTSGTFRYVDDAKKWTVGPEFDINLPFGLGIEADALYRRLRYESTGTGVDFTVNRVTTANAWDFPLLLKWRFGGGPIKPYLSAGPTFRGLSNLKQVETFFTEPSTTTHGETSSPVELRDRFNTGLTLGAGLQIGGAGFHVSPEVRYTRWGWDSFRNPAGAFKSNPSQFEGLVGITF